MKKFILLFIVLLCAVVLLGCAKESEGLEFELNDDGESYSVVGIGTCTDTDIVIPSTYEGKPVTEIAAFRDCVQIVSITIPDGVTSIGWSAFLGCTGLASIEIPNSVTSIGNSAFAGCTGLTSIEISNSVTRIDARTFSGCTGLTSIEIPNSVTSIGNSAFAGCTGLTSIEIPNSVTGIGTSTFSGCTGLTSITVDNGNKVYYSSGNCLIKKDTETLIAGCKTSIIPNSVTSIGLQAFYSCTGLTSIEIPNSVTSIGWSAFIGCTGLASITVDNGNKAYYSSGNCLIEKDTETLIAGCKTSIIPNSVTNIGKGAFSGCTGLTSIEIPNSVTSIGDSAFHGCTGLTSIEIPNSVTSIVPWAFERCTGLTSVIFDNPDGWSVDNGSTIINEEDLSDPSIAAKYLTDTYSNEPWVRN